MTDALKLSVLLSDYAEALAGHLGVVREEHTRLESAWAALSECYQGNGAEQFRRVFVATTERMHSYEHDASVLLGVLRRRIDLLTQYDSTSPEL